MKKNILVFLSCFALFETSAQSGKVSYWVTNDNINLKQELVLLFNKSESISIDDLKPFSYRTEEGYKISSPGQYNAVYMNTTNGTGTVYKRKNGGKKKMCAASIELLRKNWTIHEETKKIAKYKVQKATLSYEYTPKFGEDTDVGEIEVWFAPSIPVNTGPHSFNGN